MIFKIVNTFACRSWRAAVTDNCSMLFQIKMQKLLSWCEQLFTYELRHLLLMAFAQGQSQQTSPQPVAGGHVTKTTLLPERKKWEVLQPFLEWPWCATSLPPLWPLLFVSCLCPLLDSMGKLCSDFGMWSCSSTFSPALLSLLAVVDTSMGRAHKRVRNIQGNGSELSPGSEQPGHSSSAKGLPGTGWNISLLPALSLVRMFYRQFSIEMSAVLSTHPLPCT